MSTKDSPLWKLQAEASRIATLLKKAERGELPDVQYKEKIEEARKKGTMKVGIVMDDKVITIDITMDTIRKCSATALAAFIVKQMQESTEQ